MLNEKMTFTRNILRHHKDFRNIDARYSVSGRMIDAQTDIIDYINTYYYFLDIQQVESVYGIHAFPSKLYGGWYAPDACLTDKHLDVMEKHGIGFSVTLTNYFYEEDFYKETRSFLKKYFSKISSIVCTSDELARRIRNDFPDMVLKASILKNLNAVEKVERALTLYDQVVIPMEKNDDEGFLKVIREKDRTVLFGNAMCAYTCPERSCYLEHSQLIQGKPVTTRCSKERVPRPDLGYVAFDVKKLSGMGFRNFKLIPPDTLQLKALLAEKVK